jgi:CO/xanthine dehydrogenase FAD-binding subunit
MRYVVLDPAMPCIHPILLRRLTAAEQALIGAEVSVDRVAYAAEQAMTEATSLQHNAYKIPIAKRLMRRAILSLAQAPQSRA